MTEKFELGIIDGSAAYRLASQVIIPRLKVEVFPKKGSEPFSLRDEIYAILADEVKKGTITQTELESISRVDSKGVKSTLMSQTRYFVLHILKSTGVVMSSDTRGMFILTDAAAIEEEEEEDEVDGVVTAGSIYAYTFPSLNGSMIKVGKASGNVEERINQQLGTANPEAPQILKVWPSTDADSYELAIHSVLKARGKRVNAPRAKEWFRTTIQEVDAIIQFVKTS
ncbi:MAG: GIY-YIG nuclease family protein [Hylemonella sp.]|nr:GIY-YIG nuclease family protein [Hylemonella sp.]MDP1936830.1 GIY-YIG nuclease family protein [Hylemonella sp.]